MRTLSIEKYGTFNWEHVEFLSAVLQTTPGAAPRVTIHHLGGIEARYCENGHGPTVVGGVPHKADEFIDYLSNNHASLNERDTF